MAYNYCQHYCIMWMWSSVVTGFQSTFLPSGVDSGWYFTYSKGINIYTFCHAPLWSYTQISRGITPANMNRWPNVTTAGLISYHHWTDISRFLVRVPITHWPNADLGLIHRQRRWPNIKSPSIIVGSGTSNLPSMNDRHHLHWPNLSLLLAHGLWYWMQQ